MDFLLNTPVYPILRITHIMFGIAWVGFATIGTLVVHPLAEKLGDKGDMILRNFYGYSTYNKIFPIAAIITTLAGLIMWGISADGIDLINFNTTGDYVMATGVVFGLLAFGHGAGATGRFSALYAKEARAYEENGGTNGKALSEARAKLFTHSNISGILTVIAAVLMASARYW
ncbi:MAG: hypothetical protein AAF846_28915 [Chloroflexota bacterium]